RERAMDQLNDLLLEWEDRRRRGEGAPVEVLCPNDPGLREKLAETIQLLEAFDSLMSSASQAEPPPPPPPLPKRIGKYEVRGVLAVGGWGVVYGAWHPVLTRTVAIKVIQPRRDALAAKRAAERFLREGQLLAKCGRRNIVAALEAGEHGGVPYLVM